MRDSTLPLEVRQYNTLDVFGVGEARLALQAHGASALIDATISRQVEEQIQALKRIGEARPQGFKNEQASGWRALAGSFLLAG